MFCKNCGSNLPDDAKFCPSCGATLTNDIPPAPGGLPNAPKKICCPECGSKNLQYLSETEYSTTVKTKGYSGGKGCLGYLAFGSLGMLCGNCGSGKSQTTVNTETTHAWICKDCGSKFKTKDDLEQEIAKEERMIKSSYVVLIVFGVIAVLLFALMFFTFGGMYYGKIDSFYIIFVIVLPLMSLLSGVSTFILMRVTSKSRVTTLKEELDELEKKMARFQ